MKKILIYILLLSVTMLSGCFKNSVSPNPDKVVLYLSEDYTQYMPYEEVPSFTFTYEGVYNTIMYVSKSFYAVFATNDDTLLSQDIAKLLAKYEGRVDYVVESEATESWTRINTMENGKQVPHKYDVDDQKIVNETAYIALENGLKLTIDYRRFVSNGVTYYTWRYTSNLAMHLYYPFMVVKENDQKELLLLTLPNRIRYQVGTTLDIKKVMDDDKYLGEEMYTFSYLEDQDTLAAKKQYVIDYYVNEFDGEMINNELYYNYLGIRYKIIFNDNNFIIKYVQKLS